MGIIITRFIWYSHLFKICYDGNMKKLKNWKSYVTMLVVGILIGAFLFFGMVNLNIGQSEPKVTQTTVLEQLQSASDLITTDYHYSKVGRYENSLEINGWSIPLTNKYFILTYEGEVQLGIDLTKADIAVRGDTIAITLPPVEVLSNAIDEKSIEVYNESKNVFNPISVNDYKEFAIQQKEAVDKELEEKNYYEIAKENTIKSISQLLNMSDAIRDQYKLDIKFKDA